jgi:hypothetical protein
MKKLAPIISLLLLAAACSSETDDDGTVSPPPPTEAPQTQSPPTTQAPATSAPVAADEETTTVPQDSAPEGDASFALTQVVFGESGYVVVTNIGNGTGDVGGHWICQRPAYFEIPSVELAPGESVWIAAEDGEGLVPAQGVVAVVPANRSLGAFSVASGETGLYTSNGFGDSAAIIDYVEWGSGDHGRSSVAVEAGIWIEGTFVDVPEEAVAITGSAPTSSAADWSPDIGV